MNPDKYQELIVKRAVKAANKKRDRTRRDLDIGTLRDLKVATASPFSRILVGSIGSALLGTMIYLQLADGFSWLLSLFAGIGLYFLVVAIRGRKKRISEIENAMDFVDVGGSLVEAVIENIDFSIDL